MTLIFFFWIIYYFSQTFIYYFSHKLYFSDLIVGHWGSFFKLNFFYLTVIEFLNQSWSNRLIFPPNLEISFRPYFLSQCFISYVIFIFILSKRKIFFLGKLIYATTLPWAHSQAKYMRLFPKEIYDIKSINWIAIIEKKIRHCRSNSPLSSTFKHENNWQITAACP